MVQAVAVSRMQRHKCPSAKGPKSEQWAQRPRPKEIPARAVHTLKSGEKGLEPTTRSYLKAPSLARAGAPCKWQQVAQYKAVTHSPRHRNARCAANGCWPGAQNITSNRAPSPRLILARVQQNPGFRRMATTRTDRAL